MLRTAVIFVVIVACINMWQCVARPTDEINNLDNSLENDQSGEYMYKLPRIPSQGFVITMEGIISTENKMFTAVLPSSSGGEDCKIEYDFATKTLNVMPPSDQNYEPSLYDLYLPTGTTETTFYLVLTARTANGNQIFDVSLEGNREGKTGPSDTIACKIKSFTDIGSIVVKGVKSVNSLLFEFPK